MIKKLFLIILTFSIFTFPNEVFAAASTDPDFKVAFIGDSSAGNNFQNVLNLIKSENAQLVLHQGDFDYSSGPQLWMDKINNTLGPNFPYIGSDGNHDNWDTDGFAAFFKDRLAKMGINSPVSLPSSYSLVYKGLKIVFSQENGDPSFISSQLSGDTHTWKICSWHKNMASMQVGGKGDEQGWPDYETCRQLGAIIATGHEHSYQRTKTLTNTLTQTVDPICPNPNSLCVSPGRTFVFVSGLGGNSIRVQQRCLPTTFPYGCRQEWAKIYTSDQGATYGALFIIFNYQGNPNKAHAYFKNITGAIIDEFDILATSGTPPPITPSTTPSTGGKPGDANNDNIVDGIDYVVWLLNYNKNTTQGPKEGDFDRNGIVDGLDYVTWRNNFGR